MSQRSRASLRLMPLTALNYEDIMFDFPILKQRCGRRPVPKTAEELDSVSPRDRHVGR